MEKYPDIPIVSEESYIPPFEIRKSYNYIWLLDPLDGTKEFVNQTDEFSINLALIKNNEPVAGFIYLPVYKKLFYAIKGLGAHKIVNGNQSQLFCNSFKLTDNNLKIVISRNHLDSNTKQYIDQINNPVLIKLGSALKFISIASGEADYYPRMINIMEWDTAAGQIIIEESGGKLVDAQTNLPLKYNKPSMFNPYFIASGQIL